MSTISTTRIIQDVWDFIEAEVDDETRFSQLLVSLAQEQYRTNDVYRSWVGFKKIDPSSWETWSDVVPLPIQFFKKRDVVSFDESMVPGKSRFFYSSGTGGSRSTVKLFTDRFYDHSIFHSKSLYQAYLPELKGYTKIRLFPTSKQWVNSSLAFMFDHMFGECSSEFIEVTKEGINLKESLFKLDFSKPYIIFGTTYSMIQFFDKLIYSYGGRNLHPDTYIIDTGGSKNIERSMSRRQYLELFRSATGLKDENSVYEYGMSEISSPAWGNGDKSLVLPPWARAKTLNPVSLKTEGWQFSDLETVVYYDLANVWTVCAIQTQDIGITGPKGDIILPLGRAQGAQAKGCSILAQNGLRV